MRVLVRVCSSSQLLPPSPPNGSGRSLVWGDACGEVTAGALRRAEAEIDGLLWRQHKALVNSSHHLQSGLRKLVKDADKRLYLIKAAALRKDTAASFHYGSAEPNSGTLSVTLT